jgi:hypothetical protein
MLRAGLLLALLASGALSQDGEKGFVPLFNGKDFRGVRFFMDNKDPTGVFHIEDGAIVCTGELPGYWYTQEKYKDFTLRFDFKFRRPDDLKDDASFDGNSGTFLFITEHRIWPRSIQVQGQNKTLLSIIPMDSKAKWTEDKDARIKARKRVGEWNSVEIVSKNGQIRSSLNGVPISTVTEHEFKAPGFIGFQSETKEIHWRNIRIRPE